MVRMPPFSTYGLCAQGKIQPREGGSWRFLPPPNTAKRIMLPNERFALACRAYYDEIGLIVDKRNGQFAHCPYPEGMGDTGYYLLWEHHQHQGLLQSRDVGRICFWVGDVKKWLQECDPIPDDYFGLWGIYEEYVGEHNKKLHGEKDENGKSIFAVKTFAATLEKYPDHQFKAGKKPHEEKDETGKSKHARRVGKDGAAKVHKEKDENGKSKHAVMVGKITTSQVWESTIDNFRSNVGNVSKHNRANGWDPNARVRVEVD